MQNQVDFINDSLGIIGGLIAILSFLYWGFLKFHKKTLDPLKEDIKYIKENFIPNGGSSLRDSVNRIELKLNSLQVSTALIYEYSGLPCVTTDAEGLLQWSNKEYIQLTGGMSPFEVKGHGWVNAIHPEYREKVQKEWAICVEQGREYIQDFKMITGVEVRGHAVPVYQQNKIVKWVAVINPINT